jgi:hypothetical protein
MSKAEWLKHAKRWIDHPASFVRELFQVEPDPWQLEALEAFPHKPYCAFQACKGPGKTAVLAWLCWNFLVTRPHCNIGATSISGDNLRDNLWKEMAVWRLKSPFIQQQFEWTVKRIFRRDFESTWFMSARTWPKTGDTKAQADTLAGLHADFIMFVIDESGGVPESVMVSAEAAMSSCVEGHIVQAGNPTSIEGPLYRASKNRLNDPIPMGTKQWYVIEITGDPDDPARSTRMDLEWCKQQIRTWGRDNPWVMVNVLGKFPPGAISTLISEDEVREAMRRWWRPHEIGIAEKIIGADVARQGLDASVIAKREGIQMHNLHRYRNIDGNVGASICSRHWDEFDADACFVDATGGYGFPWIDGLKRLNKAAIPVQFSSASSQPDRYYNKRAEMAFAFVDAIRDGLALPPEESEGARELLEAASKTQYFHHKDRLQLEEKDQIRDRIGFSPDEFDACILTYAEKVTPKKRTMRGPISHSATTEYRPFTDLDRQQGTRYSPGNANGFYNPFANR